MKRIAVFAVVAALSLGGAAHAQFGPAGPAAITAAAERSGWWIRINPQNQAPRVYWRFGAAPNQLSAPTMWLQGESPEAVDVPEAQRGLETIHLASIGMPPSAPVSFCVFFQDRGVALVEFTQEKTTQVNQGDTAAECMP